MPENCRTWTKTFLWSDEGATMVEYGLMLALIAAAAMAAVTGFGVMVRDTLFELPL